MRAAISLLIILFFGINTVNAQFYATPDPGPAGTVGTVLFTAANVYCGINNLNHLSRQDSKRISAIHGGLIGVMQMAFGVFAYSSGLIEGTGLLANTGVGAASCVAAGLNYGLNKGIKSTKKRYAIYAYPVNNKILCVAACQIKF